MRHPEGSFRLEWRGVEPERQATPEDPAGQAADDRLERNPAVEAFFQRLLEKQDLHRPKPSPEAIAAALQAIQRLGLRNDGVESEFTDESREASAEGEAAGCPHCGYQSQQGTPFCGMCGAPVSPAGSGPGVNARGVPATEAQHHYHHHYHHHFIAGQDGDALTGLPQRLVGPSAGQGGGKEVKLRAAGPGTSRAEAAIRQLTQEWALACNNKQIEDLLEFYAGDAIVMRPNVPPIRGTAAIREFFVAALEAGLGDVEMELLRAEVLGDVAYQAGRCKMLVPVVMGKRREERGKYVMVFAKQKTGEWKAVVDCWASDLGLTVGAESLLPNVPGPTASKPRRM